MMTIKNENDGRLRGLRSKKLVGIVKRHPTGHAAAECHRPAVQLQLGVTGISGLPPLSPSLPL